MTQINPKAWAILGSDEKLSLNLAYIEEKSTWAAGEVMDKAHYKYLEIKYRATHFLKIFTEHFTFYDALIPEDLGMTEDVKLYFELTLGKRLRPGEALLIIQKTLGFISRQNLDKQILAWVRAHSDPEDIISLNVCNLIKEFDRWNNFRILPWEVQEPSAYKRRNKNLYKKHIKLVTKIPDVALDFIQKICQQKTPNAQVCILCPLEKPNTLFYVKNAKIELLTQTGIYLWPTMGIATQYGDLIKTYLLKEKKHCLDGLEFWPKYREIIKEAINYKQIQGIYPSREFLEMAMTKLEFYNHKNKVAKGN